MDLSYEAAISELETLLERIESGEIGLEEAIDHAERGNALIRHCRSILDRVDERLQRLEPQGDDALVPGPDAEVSRVSVAADAADGIDELEVEPQNGAEDDGELSF